MTSELDKPEVIEWIAKTAQRSELITSVCTGALLLAKARLLNGKCATTHWEDMDDLQVMFPQVQVQAQKRWVRDGDTVTSGGFPPVSICHYILWICRATQNQKFYLSKQYWAQTSLESRARPQAHTSLDKTTM